MKRNAGVPRAGQDDDALLNAIAAGGDDPRPHLAIARLELDAGNFNAAGLRAHDALAVAPQSPAAMAVLAQASFELRDFRTAATAAVNALSAGHDEGAMHYILAVSAARLGATLTDAGGVVRQPAELLATARNRAPALAARYEAVLHGASAPDYDRVTEIALLRALRLGAQPADEYYAAIEAVSARDAEWSRLLERAAAPLALGDFDMAELTLADLVPFARQRPLLTYLRGRCNLDLRIELLLTAGRRLILDQVTAGRQLPRPAAVLAETLAWQCHLNEHVFHESPGEAAKVAVLERKLADTGRLDTAEVICLAGYRDLETLPGIAALDRRRLSPAALDVLALCVDEAIDRRTRAAGIAGIAPIEDKVSQEVRAFYEATPYPRWRMLRRWQPTPRPYREVMATVMPYMQPLDGQLDDGLDVLVAGCGTGQALDGPRRYRGARITALDLSLASLVYAAQRYDGLPIRYVHGDILRLREMGTSFDVVECTGVIHHLDDPWTGVAALADVLRPGGTMLLAVYSPGARRLLAPAMALASRTAQVTLGPLRARIAAARRQVLARRLEADFSPVTTIRDFFSTSEFRDLLLHPVERPLSLADLIAGAARHGLRPIGLMPTSDRLSDRLAAEPAPASIDIQIATWSELEQAHPALFLSMLAVLFRKDGAA